MKAIENTNKTYFECFAFGDNPEMADELLALVLSGKKTATVSVVLENEQVPSVGDLSLVLDGHGNPACVISLQHLVDRKSTRLNSSHTTISRIPSSA